MAQVVAESTARVSTPEQLLAALEDSTKDDVVRAARVEHITSTPRDFKVLVFQLY